MNSQSSIDIVGKFRVGDIRHACADLYENMEKEMIEKGLMGKGKSA